MYLVYVESTGKNKILAGRRVKFRKEDDDSSTRE